jgi:poly-gamma-glutamate capsule biosynthesis protein CapA/YwtB (metallophosphatase superfamily)
VLLLVIVLLGAAGFAFRQQIGDLFGPDDSAVARPSPPPIPTFSPSPTPTEEPKRRLTIHGTGDVNVDPSYIGTYASQGYEYAWSGLDGLFEDDDLTVINLECAVATGGTPLDKEFTFRGPPESLPPMREAGVEVANLGNNHAYDFGPDALMETIRHLRDNDIAPIGAGATQEKALKPAVFEIKGWRVAVVGLDQVVDPFPAAIATEDKPGTAAGHDTDLMIEAIERADRRADLVLVTIHWGVELDTAPRPEQVELGHRFIDAGADAVFGHHSHRLQPLDHYKGRPIFWGLGNFVWPNFSPAGAITAVARVVIRPNGRVRGTLLPAFIEAPGHPVLR